MIDRVFQGFLESAAVDARQINEQSEIVRLIPDPGSGEPPRVYHGLMRGVQHYERSPDGTFRVSDSAVSFSVEFAADYCRSVDFNLQLRVVRCDRKVVHPNIHGGMVCLGNGFRPSTRLRGVIQHFYQILSSRVAATDNAFDAAAARFFLKHQSEVRALRARPLWRRPVATQVKVRAVDRSQVQRSDT